MDDACCCVVVDDYATILSDTAPVARKPHTCGECGDTIPVGQRYENVAILFESELTRHKTCLPCVWIRRDFFRCGFYYGRLVEDFRECNGWDYRDIPPEEEDSV